MDTGNSTSNDAQTKAFSASTQSFVTSLTVNSIIAGVQFIVFFAVRPMIQAVYEPRTYIPPRNEQARPLGINPLSAIWRIAMSDPKDILHKNGVDPYVFVRFLRLMCKALLPVWLISWVVFLPVDYVGTRGTNETGVMKEGIDRFTFGNITQDKRDRFWAHVILTYVFDGWFIYLLWREMQHWLVTRQRYLTSPQHSKLAQASTILITSVPPQYMDEKEIEKLFSALPGGVKRVWLNRNLKEMPRLFERQGKACKQLENAQVKMIKTARKLQMQREKQEKKNGTKLQPQQEPTIEEAELPLADRLVPRNKRPMMRLKPKWAPFSLGFLGIGKKVDIIEWCQKEIVDTTKALDESRETLRSDVQSAGTTGDTYPPLSSAFVQFNRQIAAHIAKQCLTHNQPYKMDRRFIEQSPQNVIWMNMSLGSYQANLRRVLSYGATIGLIIAYSPLTTFIGAMSKVTTLVQQFPWMSWIEGTSFGKKLLQGVITGILPPVLLALLMMILPMVLRLICTYQGMVSKTEVELSVMTRYFILLVVNSFLIVTLSSGIIASIGPIIENPTSIPSILATQLPSASTFFITLILTQFTGMVGTMLQPISLAIYYILVILGGGTPRSVFNSRYRMVSPSWGQDFPNVTVYAVIMTTYMIISPIIVGFGACFSLLSYFAYKYIYIWVADQETHMDTGGGFFPKAVTQVFVGFYLQQLCLTALFFLRKALPQAILMIILIVLTAAVHYVLVSSYRPLLYCLPLNLAHLTFGMTKDKQHENSIDTIDNESSAPLNREKRDQETEYWRESLGEESTEAAATEPKGAPSPVNEKAFTSGTTDQSASAGYADAHDCTREGELPGSSDCVPRHSMHDKGCDDWEMVELGKNAVQDAQRDPEAVVTEEEEEEKYFAVPGGPGVFRAVQSDIDDPNAFFHPAMKDPLPTVWLPRDELGVAVAEVENNSTKGISSTTRNAFLSHKGKIRVTGLPPDERQA